MLVMGCWDVMGTGSAAVSTTGYLLHEHVMISKPCGCRAMIYWNAYC